MDALRWLAAAMGWLARATIVLTLACYLPAWPFGLLMATGAELRHPEDGPLVALVWTVQVVLAMASLAGLTLLHDRRWPWLAAGTVALWVPCLYLLAEMLG